MHFRLMGFPFVSRFPKLTYAFQVNLIVPRVAYILDFSVSQEPKCLAGMRFTHI